MKNNSIKYIIGALAFIFVLTSCSKNEDTLATVQNTKQGILTFKTVDEFNETAQKVNSMKPEDKVVWEKSQGFKSFGTICDEFYATIEPQNFKTIDDVRNFVTLNIDKIQLQNKPNGDIYCVVQEFNNSDRYLMNQNKMYIIGSTVYKKFSDELVSTDIANIEKLNSAKSTSDIKSDPSFVLSNSVSRDAVQKVANANVTAADKYGQCVIKGPGWFDDNTYRVHEWIKTQLVGSNYYTTLSISNFSLSLGIWWFIDAPITYTFNYTIKDVNNNSKAVTSSGGNWITASNCSPFYYSYIYNINNIATPYFSTYYCTVTNTITDSHGTGHCVATMSY